MIDLTKKENALVSITWLAGLCDLLHILIHSFIFVRFAQEFRNVIVPYLFLWLTYEWKHSWSDFDLRDASPQIESLLRYDGKKYLLLPIIFNNILENVVF